MELIVDIGNTRTKVAVCTNGEIANVYTINNQSSADFKEIDSLKIGRGILSSVSGGEDFWKTKFPETKWLILSPETAIPFKNRYATPQTLGLDRVALVAAAATLFPAKNVLVIDAGTCVTFDFLTAGNEYLGGSISPGLQMRLKAMHHFTAKLPLVEVDVNVNLIGNSTETCLQSGALHGLAAEINGTVAEYNSRFNNLIVVLTGGDTKVLAPLVKSGIFAPQNFLLHGLHAILAYNTL